MKNQKKDINLSDKILNNEDNNSQALVQTIKKNKKEKLKIEDQPVDKISFDIIGNDNIEKMNFNVQEEEVEKFSLIEMDSENVNKKNKKAKTKTETIQQIIKSNQDSKIQYTYSDNHFSMIFIGAKLLTPNVIFSALQYHKYDVFAYKKAWHIIISRELERIFSKYKTGDAPRPPFFTHSIKLIIFRSAPTLVDEDAVLVMFKYIIDALKKDKNNPYGVLADDNPHIIFKNETYNHKGPHSVGIKLEFCPHIEKEQYSLEKILEN